MSEATGTTFVAAKGDGETWEEYAHRLESRIKQQRDHIKNLTELRSVPGDIKARKRIATLERLLGQKELALSKQHDGLHALKCALVFWVDRARRFEEKLDKGDRYMRARGVVSDEYVLGQRIFEESLPTTGEVQGILRDA